MNQRDKSFMAISMLPREKDQVTARWPSTLFKSQVGLGVRSLCSAQLGDPGQAT